MGQLHAFRPGTPRQKPGKAYYDLAQTPVVKVELQVVEDGGENRMHSHPNLDGVWYVVSGRARFYDENDRPVDVGIGEGVLVPHDTKYWFESAGEDALHVFYVAAQIPNPDPTKPHMLTHRAFKGAAPKPEE